MIQFDNCNLTITHKQSEEKQEINRFDVQRVDFFDSSICYGADRIWIWPENWTEFCNWYYAPLQPFEATGWKENKINTIKWFRSLGKLMFDTTPGLKVTRDLVDDMVQNHESQAEQRQKTLESLRATRNALDNVPMDLRTNEYYAYYDSLLARIREMEAGR